MNITLRYTYTRFITLALLCACLASCREDVFDSHDNEELLSYQFQISESLVTPPEVLFPKLQAYVFQGNVLKQIHKDLTVNNGIVKLASEPNSTIHFLNGTLEGYSELDNLTIDKTLLVDFLQLSTPSLLNGNAEPDLFYSGQITVNSAGTMPTEVSLKPSVARINLKIKNNANIKVTKIILQNIPLQTTLSGAALPSATFPTGTRTLDFPDGGIGDKDNICQVYETLTQTPAIKATIHALYHGIPCIRSITFPRIQRGFQYALTLADVGTTAEGSITVEPWTDGGTVDATDDALIYLDPNNPDGYITGNTLTVTEGTSSLTMGFLAPSEVNVQIVDGDKHLGEFYSTGTIDKEGMKLSSYFVHINDKLPPSPSGWSIMLSAESTEADPPAPQVFYLKIVPNQTKSD